MKEFFKYIGLFIAGIVIIVVILFLNNDIGIMKASIEKDARSSQRIPDDWQVAKETTKETSAMIFYDEGLSNHTFSIYVNRDGLSFGYFFRGGGSTGATMESISEFNIEGYSDRAYISMNKKKVSKIEINNGENTEVIKIDSTKPFVYILPVNTGIVTFYDINDNIVKSRKEQL